MIRGIDLNRISDFLKIVESGNITRAAEAMGDRKAKLSRSLALLEDELGVQLVYRTTRQFQLTDAGRDFYQEAKLHLGQLESSILNLLHRDDEIEGRIRLTAPEDLGAYRITPIVHAFSQIYPKVQFDLLYTNQMLDLVKFGIDLAFRIGVLKDSSLIQKKLGSLDFMLIAAPKYLESIKAPVHPEELENHRTLAFATSESKITWSLFSQEGRCSIKLKPSFVANNYITIRDLALLGHGIAFVPRFLCAEHLARGELIHILRPWRNEGSPVQVTMPQQKNVPKRIRRFFDFAAKRLLEQL